MSDELTRLKEQAKIWKKYRNDAVAKWHCVEEARRLEEEER